MGPMLQRSRPRSQQRFSSSSMTPVPWAAYCKQRRYGDRSPASYTSIRSTTFADRSRRFSHEMSLRRFHNMVNTFTLTIPVGTGQECSKKGEAQLRRAVRKSLAIVTLSSVTAVVHDLPSSRTTTEAPAIFTRPGLPTYRAWTVGGRSQRGPPLKLWPERAISRAAKHYEINKITTKRANEMGACHTD
jgi:hypothetical protein